MKDIPQLNEHNKEEYPPMHTTEHILNQTMIRLLVVVVRYRLI